MTTYADRSAPRRAEAELVAWRAALLREAGFDPAVADALARHRGVDVHAALDLVDRGCPPALAARIVAPLDDWDGGP